LSGVDALAECKVWPTPHSGMDTSAIVVRAASHNTEATAPDWALDAARTGARRAAELLRCPELPEVVVCASEGAASFLGKRRMDARDDVAAHDDRTVVIGLGAAIRLFYQERAYDASEAPLLVAYCAAFETALFSMARGSEVEGCSTQRVAEAMGLAGSAFHLAPREFDGDRYVLVEVVCRALVAIRREEGAVALWRGQVRRVVDALCAKVPFGSLPGLLDRDGRYADPEAVLRLLDFVEGSGPWPF
jgi:hypothetical protein